MTTEVLALNWKSLTGSCSPERQNYNQLRGRFVSKAEDALAKFSANYDQNIKNLDQLVEKASDLAVPYILEAVDDAVKFLVSQKVFDVDSEHFIDNFYQPYDRWTSAFEDISDRYAEIVHSGEELDAYRTARRQGRGKIIGGGFGVGGAVKGMAMAGAANLAIGAVHGAFNLAAKGISAVGDVLKKSSIFSKPETKASLLQALYESVLNVHLALLDALRASSGEIPFRGVSEEEGEKASRMLKNLQQGRLGDYEKAEVLQEVLTLNPYQEDAYWYAMANYGDANGELENVAAFFHVNLRKKKETEIRGLINDETEANAKASIDKVRSAGQHLGYPVDQTIIPELTAKLQAFDVAARTVSGKTYPTRDAAQTAAAQLEQERKEKVDAAVQTVKRGAVKTVKGIVYGVIGLILLGIIINIVVPKPQKQAPEVVAAVPAAPEKPVTQPSASPSVETSAAPVNSTPGPQEVATASAPPSSIEKLLQLAESNNSAEILRIVESIEALSKPASGDRKAARQLNEQGLTALKTSDYQSAIAFFSKGVDTDRSDQEVLNNLAYAYLESGNLVVAQEHLIGTLMLAPRRSSAWANLATLYARADKPELAVASLLTAYRFSKNQQKTIEFLQKATAGNDLKFAEVARLALANQQLSTPTIR